LKVADLIWQNTGELIAIQKSAKGIENNQINFV
jgi:hypothetical protein